MICLFVLERRLFDMCSWGRIERNVSFFFSILGLFLGENRAGYEWQDSLFWVWDFVGNIDSEAKYIVILFLLYFFPFDFDTLCCVCIIELQSEEFEQG